MVRLSAGRAEMNIPEQAFCFMAGANSIFAGEKLLTTPNPSFEEDNAMFDMLGLNAMPAFKSLKPKAQSLKPVNVVPHAGCNCINEESENGIINEKVQI